MSKEANDKKHYTVAIDPVLIKKIRVYCAINGVNQYEVIESLLTEFFAKEGV